MKAGVVRAQAFRELPIELVEPRALAEALLLEPVSATTTSQRTSSTTSMAGLQRTIVHWRASLLSNFSSISG